MKIAKMVEYTKPLLKGSPPMDQNDDKKMPWILKLFPFVVLIVLGVGLQVGGTIAYNKAHTYLNAPPTPPTKLGLRVVDSLKVEKGWKLSGNGRGIYNPQAKLYVDCTGEFTYSVLEYKVILGDKSPQVAYEFTPEDRVAIVEAAKPLHEKLVENRFVNIDE